jgi:hypothetical protein
MLVITWLVPVMTSIDTDLAADGWSAAAAGLLMSASIGSRDKPGNDDLK